jgi:hypothetical protein
MTGYEREIHRSIQTIAKSLHGIDESLKVIAKGFTKPSNVLTEQQLRSEGYDNISNRKE